jgi:hypothetical protein
MDVAPAWDTSNPVTSRTAAMLANIFLKINWLMIDLLSFP